MPFLGFPSSYEFFFTIATGLAVVVLAFLYARGKRVDRIEEQYTKREVITEVYSQKRPIFSIPMQEDFTDIDAIRSHSKTLRTH